MVGGGCRDAEGAPDPQRWLCRLGEEFCYAAGTGQCTSATVKQSSQVQPLAVTHLRFPPSPTQVITPHRTTNGALRPLAAI
jgi:hypothetical protein